MAEVRPHAVSAEVDGCAQSLIHDLHSTAREVFVLYSNASIFSAVGMLRLIALGRAAALVGWRSGWCRTLEWIADEFIVGGLIGPRLLFRGDEAHGWEVVRRRVGGGGVCKLARGLEGLLGDRGWLGLL